MTDLNAKIYISSSMTGKPNFNHQAFFEKEADLRSRGYKNILNPAIIGQKHGLNKPYAFYIREAFKMLLQADVMVLFGDWHKSKGAAWERQVAEICGIPVRVEK